MSENVFTFDVNEVLRKIRSGELIKISKISRISNGVLENTESIINDIVILPPANAAKAANLPD